MVVHHRHHQRTDRPGARLAGLSKNALREQANLRMQIRKQHLLLLALVLIYCAWAVTPVHAHALLLRSNPASNAVLAQAPAQVELFFSEPVEANLSTVSVLDSNGKSVDLGDMRVDPNDPTRMTVSLGSLLDGVYTVAWKAISAIDGHLTSGSFPFAIGNESSTVLAGQSQKTTPSFH
jgi:methionine-rich copper-binding protein CopC